MSEPKDKDSKSPGKEPSFGSEKRSGRVGYDARGNSVWEWQLETGVYSRDVSTQKLKKLELGELSIADTAVNKRPEALQGGAPGKEPLPGGGFNPYDKSPRGGGFSPYDNARNKPQPQTPGAPEPDARRKPADMRKLGEWLKMKKKMQDEQDRGGDGNDDED